MAHMIMLLTAEMPNRPDNVKLVEEFGPEGVRWEENGEEHFERGVSILVQAEPTAFHAWLGGHDVWTSNNPMLGKWNRMRMPVPTESSDVAA